MKTLNVTAAELAIAELGYDALEPTRQQEVLASIYIKALYEQNGRPLFLESGDVEASTSELQVAISEVTLPVKYASWLPSILGMACDIIALTSNSSVILREIGLSAIDRLIDHTIRVIFDNLFAQDAPTEEQPGESAAEIAKVVAELEEIKALIDTMILNQQRQVTQLWDDRKGTLFTLTSGVLEEEEL